jgi:hypothetical protein
VRSWKVVEPGARSAAVTGLAAHRSTTVHVIPATAVGFGEITSVEIAPR